MLSQRPSTSTCPSTSRARSASLFNIASCLSSSCDPLTIGLSSYGTFSHPSTGWDAASASAPQTFSFYLVSLVSFIIAGGLVVRLYRAVHPDGMFAWLVYPIFMVLVLWTYVIHIDANFSYPYDMPSLAFFAGGLLAIYTRRFVPLVLIVLLGTINRETTLFLVGIYILDAATCEPLNTRSGLVSAERNPRQNRFLFAQVPWLRAGLLLALWLAVKPDACTLFPSQQSRRGVLAYSRELSSPDSALMASTL